MHFIQTLQLLMTYSYSASVLSPHQSFQATLSVHYRYPQKKKIIVRLKKSSKILKKSTFQLLRTTRTPLHSFRLISLSTKNPIHSIYSILLIILIILFGNSLIIAANDFSYSRMPTHSIAPNPTISKKKKFLYFKNTVSPLTFQKFLKILSMICSTL